MKQKKGNIRNIRFTLRIYDEPTLQNLDALMATNYYDNFNFLLNKCLWYGSQVLMEKEKLVDSIREDNTDDYFDDDIPKAAKNFAPQFAEVKKEIQELKKSIDETFVVESINQFILTTLYNVEREKINGKPVSCEMMDNGYYSDLPDILQQVYQELYPNYEGDDEGDDEDEN